MSDKIKTLFVGSFREPKDGTIGGQTFACKSLIDSPLKEKVDFILIDSTMKSLPAPHILIRALSAIKRLVEFLYKLSTKEIKTVLIFSSAGLSLIEKGIMSLIANYFGKRVIVAPRSGLIIDDIDSSSFLKGGLKLLLSNSDVIICQSQQWKNFYQRFTGFQDERFLVIKNWIDISDYNPKIQNDPKNIRVLFMGWIERNKGIIELLEAVSIYRNKLQGVKFIICGGGSKIGDVRKYIKSKNLDKFFIVKGWVSGKEKMLILRQSDILILPSYREGLPNVILEAMASGCAVIANSVGSIPDVIDNSINGILLDSNDPSDIGESILTLVQDGEFRKQIAENAVDTISKDHNIDVVWEHVYVAISNKVNT